MHEHHKNICFVLKALNDTGDLLIVFEEFLQITFCSVGSFKRRGTLKERLIDISKIISRKSINPSRKNSDNSYVCSRRNKRLHKHRVTTESLIQIIKNNEGAQKTNK